MQFGYAKNNLQDLNFIDIIVPDLELNAFHIYFNQKHEIDFSLKKGKDTGFVAELRGGPKKTTLFYNRATF